MRPTRATIIYVTLILALIALAALRLFVGTTFGWPGGNLPSSITRVFLGDWLPRESTGVLGIRVIHVCVAIVAGVALSTSGVALQTLLRNPLAEPFILGLSGGAAVGYIAQQMLAKRLGHPLGPLHIGTLLGGLATLAIVYAVGRRKGVVDPLGMLLTGVVLSAFNGAIIMILYHFNTEGDMAQLARWMQGHIEESPGSAEMLSITLLSFAGLGLLLLRNRAMDAALFSDAEAIAMGVDLTGLRTMMFLVASVLASGAVVVVGPLAFAGLICPHIARLIFGPAHRNLLIASAILGALLLVLADTVMATIQQRQFPIGVFTAIVGGPVFLSMLRPRMGRGE